MRTEVLWILAGALTAGAALADRVVLNGVGPYQACEPMFEAVRLVLTQRGEPWSAAYVQGISGAAFRIAGICPCAPTCACAMSPQDLVKLFGYEVETVYVGADKEDVARRRPGAIERVKQELRAGRPVVVWHAFTNAEYDVVAGFDDDAGTFLGRGSYKGLDELAVADQTRCGDALEFCDALGLVVVGAKTGQFDPRTAELAALREAVRHAHTPPKPPDKPGGWAMQYGLACYDRWIAELRDDPKRKRGVGDSYCLGIYHSTHRAAAAFLRELKPWYPAAEKPLEEAAVCFGEEADALDACLPLLWWDSPEGPDVERNHKAAAALQRARDAYAAGIGKIEVALQAIDAVH
ncbi:MAG: hypothetical protein HYU66_08190 [Armatimonadetes bacterium]|nr:hypothetical protein [Armatimonadota bacterium]